MSIVLFGYVSYVVLLWIPLHSVIAGIDVKGHPVPLISLLYWRFTVLLLFYPNYYYRKYISG
jgi:hypothetical protein